MAAWDALALGAPIKVVAASNSNRAYRAWGALGRVGNALRFTWFEDGEETPRVVQWSGTAWVPVGSGTPGADLGLAGVTAGALPTVDGGYNAWRRSTGEVVPAYWNGSAWVDRSGASGLASDGGVYGTCVDSFGRLCLMVGGSSPGIYRWDGSAFSLVGDPFPGTWPVLGDSDDGARTCALVAKWDDETKLAVVVAQNAADGTLDSTVALAVWFWTEGTWAAEAVTVAMADSTYFRADGSAATCQAASSRDGIVYAAVAYEVPGSPFLGGPVSVARIPWGGTTWAPWPGANPANLAISDDGWTTYYDGASVGSLAVNYWGTAAVLVSARDVPANTDQWPVAISTGGSWSVHPLPTPASSFAEWGHIIRGSASNPDANCFVAAVPEPGDSTWRVYQLCGPGVLPEFSTSLVHRVR